MVWRSIRLTILPLSFVSFFNFFFGVWLVHEFILKQLVLDTACGVWEQLISGFQKRICSLQSANSFLFVLAAGIRSSRWSKAEEWGTFHHSSCWSCPNSGRAGTANHVTLICVSSFVSDFRRKTVGSCNENDIITTDLFLAVLACCHLI